MLIYILLTQFIITITMGLFWTHWTPPRHHLNTESHPLRFVSLFFSSTYSESLGRGYRSRWSQGVFRYCGTMTHYMGIEIQLWLHKCKQNFAAFRPSKIRGHEHVKVNHTRTLHGTVFLTLLPQNVWAAPAMFHMWLVPTMFVSPPAPANVLLVETNHKIK